MCSLVIYYSRTGNTHTVAKAISSTLDDPTVERIRPVRRRRYANWLLRSFVPGARVPIRPVETDLSQYDGVFLGTPKWTLSCPPVTEYIARADFTGVELGLFLTYGGFDEDRYRRDLVDRLVAEGADVVATLSVKRDAIGTLDRSERIDAFCNAVIDR